MVLSVFTAVRLAAPIKTMPGSDAEAPDVKVPLIKNTKVLKPGDKLVLFVPAVLSLHPVPAIKKQKTLKRL